MELTLFSNVTPKIQNIVFGHVIEDRLSTLLR
jgi:hypothetical protein